MEEDVRETMKKTMEKTEAYKGELKHDDDKKVYQPKEIQYLRKINESVQLGIDTFGGKLNNFMANMASVKFTLGYMAKMAERSILAMEEFEGEVPESFKEYVYDIIHTCSHELGKIKIPLKLPAKENEIFDKFLKENPVLQDLIYDADGAMGLRGFARQKEPVLSEEEADTEYVEVVEEAEEELPEEE